MSQQSLPDSPIWSTPGFVKAASMAILTLGIMWAHAPALNRFFAADQVWYFAELEGDRSLAKGLSFWDYSTSRQYWCGDQLLFRPVLFSLLAVENTLFGADNVAWNAVNLGLHVLTSWMLFVLLWHIWPGPYAFLFALFFAVNRSLIELVLWNHLSGYLLAAFFLLLSLYSVLRCIEEDRPKPQVFWASIYALAGLLGALSYELGAVMAILGPIAVVGFCPRTAGRRNIVAVALATIPAVGFGIGYCFHVANASRLTWVHQSGPERTVFMIIGQCVRCLGTWLFEAIDPWRSTLMPTSPFDKFTRVLASPGSPAIMLRTAGLLLAFALLVVVPNFSGRALRRRSGFACCVGLLLVAYTLIINAGRSAGEGITYYLYFFCLLLVLATFSMLGLRALPSPMRFAGGVFLLVLSLCNLVVSRHTSLAIHEQNLLVNDYFFEFRRVLESHADEPDFTVMAVGVPNSLDPPWIMVRGFPNTPTWIGVRRVSSMIYPQFYSDKPRYELFLTSKGLEADLVRRSD